MTDEELTRRAAERGVVTGYHDAMGTWREPPVDVLRAILEAMGDPTPAHERAVVVRPARPVACPGWARGGTVHCEDGAERAAPETLPGDLPPGYHRLVHGGRELPLIVAPDLAHMPEALAGGGRMWGVACQLYALRGGGSWGMGDMSGLAALPRVLGDPHFILVSPLHAPNPGPHPQPSPYFASSRIHRNPLHLALEAAPEMGALTDHERARMHQLGEMGRALSHDELIHRDAIWALKREGLALLTAAALRTPHRAAALDRFRAEVHDVDGWARFCGLVEAHGADRGAWGDARVTEPVSDMHVARPDADGRAAGRAAAHGPGPHERSGRGRRPARVRRLGQPPWWPPGCGWAAPDLLGPEGGTGGSPAAAGRPVGHRVRAVRASCGPAWPTPGACASTTSWGCRGCS
ncbi:MAG: 4-alpha-glucanotransferase [Thermoleophilia bacterium]